MKPHFYVTEQAREDLDDIWDYIAKDNKQAANKIEGTLIRAFAKLATNPHPTARALLAGIQLPDHLPPGCFTTGNRAHP